MYKHSDRKKESIHSILLKLLIATQLMFGLGTRHKAQDVVMACEKTEFLFSDISKNNQFIFYFEAQITEQACFSISNQDQDHLREDFLVLLVKLLSLVQCNWKKY